MTVSDTALLGRTGALADWGDPAVQVRRTGPRRFTVRARVVTALMCLGLTGGVGQWASGQTVSCNQRTFAVDLRARTVAGVSLDVSGDSLVRAVGAERVLRTEESLEGQASPLYVVDICGHMLARHWNGLSWRDSVFTTDEAVRVGDPLSAFDAAYGLGKAMWSEAGLVIAYRYDDLELFATVDQGCVAESDVGGPAARSRDCRVKELWVPLQTSPE